MRYILLFILSILFFSGLGQTNDNENLKSQILEFSRKVKIEVRPELNFQIDKNHCYNAEIHFDITSYPIKGKEYHLFLIDNFEKTHKAIREYIDGTGFVSLMKDSATYISLKEPSEKLKIERFTEKGYQRFSKRLIEPINVSLCDTNRDHFKIVFRFILAEKKKNKFDFFSESVEAYWVFYLPKANNKNIGKDSSQETVCGEKADEYKQRIEDLKKGPVESEIKTLKAEVENNESFTGCGQRKSILLEISSLLKETAIAQQEPTERPTEESGTQVTEYNKYKKKLDDLERNLNGQGIKADKAKKIVWESITENRKELERMIEECKDASPEISAGIKAEADKKIAGSFEKDNKSLTEHSKRFEEYRQKAERNAKDVAASNDPIVKALADKFSNLRDQASTEIEAMDPLLAGIEMNKKLYEELLTCVDPNIASAMAEIRLKFTSLFARLYGKTNIILSQYEDIEHTFDDKKNGKFYFKWIKKGIEEKNTSLLHDLSIISDSADYLAKKKDSITKAKNVPIDISITEETEMNGMISRLEWQINYLSQEINDWPHAKFPFFYLLLLLLLLGIVGFGGTVYLRAWSARRKLKPVVVNNSQNGQTMVKVRDVTLKKDDKKTVRAKGLEVVRKQVGKGYLLIDMAEEWDDSAVKHVYFNRECIVKTYRFFEDSIHSAGSSSMAHETGGYLIGKWDFNPSSPGKYDISLEDFIEPGEDAEFSQYQLNFGNLINLRLQGTLENCRNKGQDFIMTAWFHSHPGLKIFLSDFDLKVQQGFTDKEHSKRMMALVLDPYTDKWDTGVFAYKTDGSMNNAADSKSFYSLEEMYNWAIRGDQPDMKEFFNIELTGKAKNKKTRVHFTNPAILEMKRIIEDNRNRIEEGPVCIASFTGKLLEGDLGLLVEHSIPFAKEGQNDESKDVLGFLVLRESEEEDEVLKAMENDDVSFISILTKNETDLRFINSTEKNTDTIEPVVIPLGTMIKWTRKRI